MSTAAISDRLWILGYEFDEQGKPIPGATLRYDEDLMKEGIAWNYPNTFEMPEFVELVKNVRKTFNQL